jgi:DNA invertase Pin-like site-specific DNA recombinase
VVPEAYVCLDDGSSGTRLERPGLQRLRELIRARAIDAIIVADLARLSRTVSHQLLLAEECNDAGVTVHVVLSSSISTCDDLSPLLTTLRRPREREELTNEPTA